MARFCWRISPDPAESKRNRRMIKMKTIDVRLMAYSFSGKRSSWREGRRERPATDSKQRTRTKRSSLSLQQWDLSSRYILKHSKIDISRNVKSFLDTLTAVATIRRASRFHARADCGRRAGNASSKSARVLFGRTSRAFKYRGVRLTMIFPHSGIPDPAKWQIVNSRLKHAFVERSISRGCRVKVCLPRD